MISALFCLPSTFLLWCKCQTAFQLADTVSPDLLISLGTLQLHHFMNIWFVRSYSDDIRRFIYKPCSQRDWGDTIFRSDISDKLIYMLEVCRLKFLCLLRIHITWYLVPIETRILIAICFISFSEAKSHGSVDVSFFCPTQNKTMCPISQENFNRAHRFH